MEFIYVITMRAGEINLPNNVSVSSVGKEKGYSEPRRVVEFYRLLLCILKHEKIDACFSHMIPIFTILATPLMKARKIPIITWYAHPNLTWTLKLAHHLSDRVITSIKSAYPYRQDKLVVVGQGIDMDLFSPDRTPSYNSPMILCVGRISRSKDHPTLLKSVSILKDHFKKTFSVVILGGLGSSADEPYMKYLNEMIKELGIEDIVRFNPPVPMMFLPHWYNKCTVHVNMTPEGFSDKVALEAMACGRPCVMANEGFRDTLGQYAEDLLFKFGDPYSLLQCLSRVLSLEEENRRIIGSYLRDRVANIHNKDDFVKKLMDVFASCNMNRKRN